jgi:hypothetical protein
MEGSEFRDIAIYPDLFSLIKYIDPIFSANDLLFRMARIGAIDPSRVNTMAPRPRYETQQSKGRVCRWVLRRQRELMALTQ